MFQYLNYHFVFLIHRSWVWRKNLWHNSLNSIFKSQRGFTISSQAKMPLGCMFNCILTPSHTARDLQAPVEKLRPILSLNKLWNAPGKVVNLSPLQTTVQIVTSLLWVPTGTWVCSIPTPWNMGQLDHYISMKSKQPAQFSCVHKDEKKKTVGPPNIDSRDNLFVLKVFKTHKQVPSGHKWLALYSYYHTSLECLLHTWSLKTLSWITPPRWPDKSLTHCIHGNPRG